jgi:hypothetical protein
VPVPRLAVSFFGMRMARALVAVPLLVRVVVSRLVMAAPISVAVVPFALVSPLFRIPVPVSLAMSVALLGSVAAMMMVSMLAVAPFFFLLRHAILLGPFSG